MWEISKEFDFCYGHRVHNQELNEQYALSSCNKCRRLHGHQGKIVISIPSQTLNKGMVVDFNNLSWFKKWVDDTLDHKMILDIEDPARTDLFPGTFFEKGDNEKFDKLFQVNKMGNSEYYTVWPDIYSGAQPHLQEIYEGLVFVPFVPTSENLSKWFLDIVSHKMQPLGVTINKVQFFETPKSQSTYTV